MFHRVESVYRRLCSGGRCSASIQESPFLEECMQSFSFPITLLALVQGYGEETIGYVTLGYPSRRCAETGKIIRNVGFFLFV